MARKPNKADQAPAAAPAAAGVMQIIMRPIAELVPDPENAREHPADQIGQIVAAIRAFKTVLPVLIDERGQIIAGHGSVIAAKQLGHVEVPTITLSHLAPAEKKAFALAHNRIPLNAKWNDGMLAANMRSLVAASFNVELTAFSLDELRAAVLPGQKGGKNSGGSGSIGGLRYQVVIDCDDEDAQAELLEKLREDGLSARPLIL